MSNEYDEYTGYQAMLSSHMEIRLYRNLDLDKIDEHTHDFYEIFFLTDGHVIFHIEGREYEAERGDIILIPPGVAHSETPGEIYERIMLRLNPWYLNRISSKQTKLTHCFISAQKRGYIIQVNPYLRNRLKTLLCDIWLETKENRFGKDILIEAELKKLLIILERCHSERVCTGRQVGRDMEDTLDQMIHYIDLHYTEAVTLNMLCERFYISKFYLERSFEHITGKSVYQYILEKRMLMAKQLLLFGERPTDIYALCGFTHYSNFYRAFKKYYGLPPGRFLAGSYEPVMSYHPKDR